MSIDLIFDRASSVMTVLSFATFIGILLWTFLLRAGSDFDRAAALPFADEESEHG